MARTPHWSAHLKQGTRLLLRATVPMILASLAVFALISLLSIFINELDELNQGSYSVFGALMYTVLAAPTVVYNVLPYGVIVGLLTGLGRMASRQELIALQLGGMSRAKIGATVMFGAMLVVAAVVGVSEWIGGSAERIADAMVANAKQIGLNTGAQSGLWMKEGRTILNAGMVVSDDGAPPELWNVRLYRYNEQGQLEDLVQSPRAMPMAGAWRLESVTVRSLLGGFKVTQLNTLEWKSSLNAELIAARSQRPKEQSVTQIQKSIAYAKLNGLNYTVLSSAFWFRISHPLSVLALAIIALPFAFAETRNGSFGRHLFFGIMLGIGFFFVQRSIANTFEFMELNLAVGHLVTPTLLVLIGAWALSRSGRR